LITGSRTREPVYIGGVELEDWYRAFLATHNLTDKTILRIDYPNGGNYLEQEQIMLDMFSLIKDELFKQAERNGKRNPV